MSHDLNKCKLRLESKILVFLVCSYILFFALFSLKEKGKALRKQMLVVFEAF